MGDDIDMGEMIDLMQRLLRIFPSKECFAHPFRPGDYNTRFSQRLGHLDITFDHEKLVMTGIKVVRVTVWNNCDALLAVDIFENEAIDRVHHCQDAKVREQLIPLINTKLVLDDLAGVEEP